MLPVILQRFTGLNSFVQTRAKCSSFPTLLKGRIRRPMASLYHVNAMLNAHLTIVSIEYAVTVLGPDDITNGDI